MKVVPVAATLVVVVAGMGCGSAPPEWIVAPTPDAAVVVGEGWRSVLPRTWSAWPQNGLPEGNAGSFWRSPDGSCVAGIKRLRLRQDARAVVWNLSSPHRNTTAYLDANFRVDLGGAQITRHWIGGRLSAELEVANVSHKGTYFHEWTMLTVEAERTVLLARCTAPEELAEAATPVCDAFLANLRLGDAP